MTTFQLRSCAKKNKLKSLQLKRLRAQTHLRNVPRLSLHLIDFQVNLPATGVVNIQARMTDQLEIDFMIISPRPINRVTSPRTKDQEERPLTIVQLEALPTRGVQGTSLRTGVVIGTDLEIDQIKTDHTIGRHARDPTKDRTETDYHMIDFVTAQPEIVIAIAQTVIGQENGPQEKGLVNVLQETDQETGTYGKNPMNDHTVKSPVSVAFLKRALNVPKVVRIIYMTIEVISGAQTTGIDGIGGPKGMNGLVTKNMTMDGTVAIQIDIKGTRMIVAPLTIMMMTTTAGHITMIGDLGMMIKLFTVQIDILAQMIITLNVMNVVVGEVYIHQRKGHLIWTLA